MEISAILLIPLFVIFLLMRLLWAPVRNVLRFTVHSSCGLLCLWLLNIISSFTGIRFPLNAVTVSAAGFGGLPAIAFMALLMFIP